MSNVLRGERAERHAKEICQPRTFSFNSLRDCSITIARLCRRRKEARLSRSSNHGMRFPATSATGWLRPRVWRFSSWKATRTFRRTHDTTSPSRAKRGGDAEPAPSSTATVGGTSSFRRAESRLCTFVQIAVNTQGLRPLAHVKVMVQQAVQPRRPEVHMATAKTNHLPSLALSVIRPTLAEARLITG